MDNTLLGKSVSYTDHYAPHLLFPIARAHNRATLDWDANHAVPFHGYDLWNAYELSWLTPRGMPVVAVARFDVPASSPNIIESKSFKLYLNSFSGEALTQAEVQARLHTDLSAAAGAPVQVHLTPAARFHTLQLQELAGHDLDAQDVTISHYGPPDASLLATLPEDTGPAGETLRSNLLKSNCPVTGQPDWGSVQIQYRGARIDRESLVRYLVSFRNHSDFHEHCVERIFTDLWQHCRPAELSVYARYTRRGGLDINPFRSSSPNALPPENPRGARQ